MADKPGVIARAKLAMKVFQGGIPRRGTPRAESKKVPYVFPAWRQGAPQWSLVDYETYVSEGYNINSLLFEAIGYKMRTASIVPFRVYTGDKVAPVEVVDESIPLVQLVNRPNPLQSWQAFQQQLTVYMNISGNAYVFMDRPERGAYPTAMYSLRPDRVFIVPKKGVRELLGFLYVPEGKGWQEGTPILPEDIAHIKFPNPGDPLEGLGYGFSPITPAAQSIDSDNALTSFLKQFFDSGTMINVYITFDQPMEEDVLTASKERFMELYGGSDKWTEIAALDSGGKIQQFGMKFNEMQFSELDERSEARIIGPLGVPLPLLPSRLGMKASTYSNITETRQIYWQDTLMPELGLSESELGHFLNTEDYWVHYDHADVPALSETLKMRIEMWTKLVAWGVPKREAAIVTNVPLRHLEDGTISYMPLNMAAVDANGIPTNPAYGANPEVKALITLAHEIQRASNLLEESAPVVINNTVEKHPFPELESGDE